MNYRVKDITLADGGKRRIDWAEAHMPVMVSLGKKFEKTKPLKGLRVAGCLHVTKETGVLVRTLKAAGAELSWPLKAFAACVDVPYLRPPLPRMAVHHDGLHPLRSR